MEYVAENGYPPSIREIGTNFNISSLRGVTVHLDALQRKNYIARTNTPRSIKIIHPAFQYSGRYAMVPIVGTIAAGTPILAEENIEGHLPVPIDMVKPNQTTYLLRIYGDSMINKGILPRDLVVVREQHEANNGDIVAFSIDGEATVKTFQKVGNSVTLLPANDAYQPIPVNSEDSYVIGKVIGLLRDYEGYSF